MKEKSSLEETEPFYVLADEEIPSEKDSSDEELQSAPEENVEETKESNYHPMTLLFRLLCRPVHSWKEIKRKLKSPDEVARGCFYPLLALTAAVNFAALFYDPTTTLAQVLVESLVLFLTFFASYFLTGFLWKMTLPKKEVAKVETPYAKVMLMMVLSSILVFAILNEALPILEPILVFCPIYSIYLLTRGCRFLLIDKRVETKSICIMAVETAAVPIALYYAFSEVMTNSL